MSEEVIAPEVAETLEVLEQLDVVNAVLEDAVADEVVTQEEVEETVE